MYMVEIFVGTSGSALCCPFSLPLGTLRYAWGTAGTMLESHMPHSTGSLRPPLSGPALVISLHRFLRLSVCLLQQSLLSWTMDVPDVCWWQLGGGPGGSAWESGGGEAAVQTEGLCSKGCWAGPAFTKQPVSRMCPQPGGMALSYPRLLPASRLRRVPWALALPSFQSPAPNTDQTLDS